MGRFDRLSDIPARCVTTAAVRPHVSGSARGPGLEPPTTAARVLLARLPRPALPVAVRERRAASRAAMIEYERLQAALGSRKALIYRAFPVGAAVSKLRPLACEATRPQRDGWLAPCKSLQSDGLWLDPEPTRSGRIRSRSAPRMTPRQGTKRHRRAVNVRLAIVTLDRGAAAPWPRRRELPHRCRQRRGSRIVSRTSTISSRQLAPAHRCTRCGFRRR